MDGLEHGILPADVGGSRGTHAALHLSRLVGDDVAVKVRQNEDLKIAAAGGIEELGRKEGYVPLVRRDLGIILRDLAAEVEKLAVGRLDDVGLGNDRNAVLVVVPRVLVGTAGYPLGALGGRYDKVHREVVVDVHALGADGVRALGILAEEGPVDALVGYPDGPYVGEEVESLAHRDVRALDVRHAGARLRSGRRALEDDVAGLELFEDVVGDGLHVLEAVLKREPLYVKELHLSRRDLVAKDVFEHVGGRLGDERAYAVAAANAYAYLLLGRKVGESALAFDKVDAVALLAQQLLERLYGVFDIKIRHVETS